MITDEVIRLAKEAGFHFYDAGHAPVLHTVENAYSEKCFERFAKAIERAVREKCASEADYLIPHCANLAAKSMLMEVACAIRSTGLTSIYRQPLTNEQIVDIANKARAAESGDAGYILPVAFARAIEAAHGIT